MKSNKKLLTGIIIAVISCVVAALIVAGVILFGKNAYGGETDNSVSVGYIKYFNNVPSGSTAPPSAQNPYFCAYRFETNEYEANAVNCKFSYAISKSTFEELYENKLWNSRSDDAITEYNIYLLIKNTTVTAKLKYSIPEYAQQLKEYETGVVQNGIYVHEKFKYTGLSSFPFDKYSLSLYRNDNELVYEFAHTEEMNLPEQLFVDDSGCIGIYLEECVTYASGRVEYSSNNDNTYFHYLKEGNQIKISRTSFD